MILGSFQAQRARVIAAADTLVPRPVRPLALARTVPRNYFTLAARAMEFALGAAHRTRRLGAALLLRLRAALLHWFSLFYDVDGVRRPAASSGGDNDACMFSGAAQLRRLGQPARGASLYMSISE